MNAFSIHCHRPLIRLLSVCALLLAVLWCVPQEAQARRKLIDSHGRDFWLTFIPNFHNYKTSQQLNPADSLYIFIAATQPTNGVISYRNRNGQAFQQPFTIADPSQIYSFRVRDAGFELEGFNNSGDFVPSGGQGERIAPQSFHVTAEADVTVYALSQAFTTSDAFLVLPTDAIGKEYLVMAYTSDNAHFESDQATPSQFAVVATEDNTELVITPTAPTFINRSAPQRVILNQGDCYLVQAYMGPQRDQTTDLTGSRVQADKPIAVFAGHQRATVPQWGSNVSRDVLIEQMPSVETWGLSAFITPFEQPQGTNPQVANDLYRVLAAFDNTQIFIDGVLTATLAAGGYYESVLNRPVHLTASSPVLVGQLKESATDGFGGGNNKTGDPFLMLIPPSEQFLNAYRFISVQAMRTDDDDITYLEQYVSIVAPDSKLATVRLDGAPVNAVLFNAIAGSGYSFMSIPVSDGVHTVEADTGIGVYVYGYGNANSYGYIGGTNYSPVDFLPPRIKPEIECAGLNILLLDDQPSDYHLERVDIPSNSIRNVNITVDEFRELRDSIRISARLVDPYSDGSFSLSVSDSSGFEIDTMYTIPGFTVRAKRALSNTDIPYERHNVEVGTELCVDYVFVNTGSFPQRISSIEFARSTPGFTVKTPLPLIIPPGDSAAVQLCFAPQKRGSFVDSLVIGSDCGERSVFAFSVVTGRAQITLQVMDAKANPGRLTDVKIKILHADGLDWSGVKNIKAVFRYNAAILAFRGQGAVVDPIAGDTGSLTFEAPLNVEGDSILTALRFYAGLASDSVSALVLDTAYATDGEADIVLLPGTFLLTGICYDGGVRLLNPSGRIALAPPRPNPASDVAEIDLEAVEKGRTRLEVVDLLGRTVAVAFDGELDTGLHVLSFDVGGLGAGSYNLVLRTPTEMIVQRLEVVR